MGLRFRKSINLGKGMRVNLSKSGIGWSTGVKGLRYTKRADGKTQTTASIPGTGISYVKVHGDNKNSSENSNDNFKEHKNTIVNGLDLLMVVFIILFPIIGLPMFLIRKKIKNNPKNIVIAVIIGLYLTLIRVPLFVGVIGTPNSNVVAETKVEDKNVQEEVSKQSENVVENTETQSIEPPEESKTVEEVTTPLVEKSQEIIAPPVPVQNEVKVYLSKSGKKYHRNPNCGNMENAKEVNLSDVEGTYEPCSKCN